jgi:hypothetical protein
MKPPSRLVLSVCSATPVPLSRRSPVLLVSWRVIISFKKSSICRLPLFGALLRFDCLALRSASRSYTFTIELYMPR